MIVDQAWLCAEGANVEGAPVIPLQATPLAVVAVEALPVRLAVIVPAEKFPEASLETMALAVLAFVAVVAELLTLPEVAMVANFVSTIPADALISASTIAPLTIFELDIVSSAIDAAGTFVRAEPLPENAVAVTVPFTSRAVAGFVLPMPTLPPL